MSRLQSLRPALMVTALAYFSAGTSLADDALATIDGEPVTYAEYEQFAYAEARQTYYHGKPPEGQAMIDFRRAAAEKLIDRKLLVREARRLGFEPDADSVDAQLAGYEAQYGNTPRWQSEGPAMLERLRAHFEEQSLLEKIEAQLRTAPSPAEGSVEAYYRDNLDKFTEPAKLRVSVILLTVPAWSDQEAWDAAREEAEAIAQRIRDGQPFAEAARLHSADPTAENGGDMGYLHAGALNHTVQEVVEKLEPGQMAPEPVTVLEGVVLVRLEDRRDAQVHDFADVRERATGLWQRDATEQSYKAALEKLRASTDIRLDETYLNTLPE